jgi:hypothetical protein
MGRLHHHVDMEERLDRGVRIEQLDERRVRVLEPLQALVMITCNVMGGIDKR